MHLCTGDYRHAHKSMHCFLPRHIFGFGSIPCSMNFEYMRLWVFGGHNLTSTQTSDWSSNYNIKQKLQEAVDFHVHFS